MTSEPFYHKITRALLHCCTAVCMTNPEEYQQIRTFDGQPSQIRAGVARAPPKVLPRWPRILFYVNLLVHLKWCVTLYWQFRYDVDSLDVEKTTLRMNNLDLGVEGNETMRSRLVALGRWMQFQLEESMESRRILKALGQPLSENHWMIFFLVLGSMVTNFCMYFSYIILTSPGPFRQMKLFDLHFIRALLNPSYDALRTRRLVLACGRQYKRSSRNYVRNLSRRSEEALEILGSAPTCGVTPRERNLVVSGVFAKLKRQQATSKLGGSGEVGACVLRSQIWAQFSSHQLTCQQLSELLDDGALLPINRSQEWLDEKSRKFALKSTFMVTNSAIFWMLAFVFFPLEANKLHLDSLADLVAFLEIWLIAELSMLSFMNHVTVLDVNTSDQRRYMDWLSARVQHCVRANTHLMSSLPVGRAPDERSPVESKISRNLARTLMDYEVFLAQFRPVKRSFSFCVLSVTALSLGVLALIRLQMPYTDASHHSVTIYYFLLTTITVDLLQVPLCRIDGCSRRLYARLATLLSQAIELDEIHWRQSVFLSGGAPASRSTQKCDRHLIWQLRTILGDSGRFMDQFTAQVIPGVSTTWPNLLRLHYWYTILILSHFYWTKSWTKLFGSRLGDPLNLSGSRLEL